MAGDGRYRTLVNLSAIYILVCLLIFTESAFGEDDELTECEIYSQNPDGGRSLTFASNSTSLLFGTQEQFQFINCESYNFCSIKWFFNDVPYDAWNFETDSFTKYFLADSNQTLTFTSVDCDAEGVYRCEASDEEMTIGRNVTLQIEEPVWNESPIQVQSSSLDCQNKIADLGGNVSFLCQFAYKNPGPFLQCNSWYKYNYTREQFVLVDFFPIPGTTFTTDSDDESEAISSKCVKPSTSFDVTSTWMNITNVTEEAFGLYQVICHISQHKTTVNLTLSLASPERNGEVADTTTIAITLCTLITFLTLCMLCWKKYGIDMKLWYHDNLAEPEKDDKEYDAYIVSSCKGGDEAFVDSVLYPSLQGRYKLFLLERDAIFGTVLSEEIVKAMSRSRRCIVVLSPDFHPPTSSHSSSSSPSHQSSSGYNQNWAPFELDHALDIMRSHRNRIIPLIYGDFDLTELDPSDSTGKMINYVLKNLNCLRWKQMDREKMEESVLRRLRLRLPPVRNAERLSWRQKWLPKRMYSSSPLNSPRSPSLPPLRSISASAMPHSSAVELQQLPWFDPTQPYLTPSSPTWCLSTHSTITDNKPKRTHSSVQSSLHPTRSPAQVTRQYFPSTPSSPSSSSMSISSQSLSSSSSSLSNESASPPWSSSPQYSSADRHISREDSLNGNNTSKNDSVGNSFLTFDVKGYFKRSRSRSEPYLIDNESLPDGFRSALREPTNVDANWF